MEPPVPGGKPFPREWVFAWGMAVLAFAVRLIPWKMAFAGGNLIFGQPDAYYHLRRATIFLHTFPRVPGIDRYMAHPFGAECPWPPLYDLLIAALSWGIGFGAPSYRVIHGVTTFLPPVLAGLTVIPIFLLARHVAGNGAGMAAALFAVVMPGQLNYSVVGSGDHHTAETLLLVTFLYLFLRGAGSEEVRRNRRYGILAGCVLGAAVLVWQGSIVFAVVLVSGVSAWELASGIRGRVSTPPEDPGRIHRVAAYALGVAVALVSLGRAVYPSETEQTRFGFGFFSWFQPFFLLLLLAALALVRRILRPKRGAGRKEFLKMLAVGAAAVAALFGLLFLFPFFRENVLDGVRFLLTRNAYLRSISEFQPSFDTRMFRQGVSWPFLADLVYFATFLLPPALCAWIFARKWRGGEPLQEISLFTVWTWLFAFLMFRQRRWGNAYAANIAIAIGWATALAYRGNRRFTLLWSDFLAWREERRPAAFPGGGDSRFRRMLRSPKLSVGAALLFLAVVMVPYYISIYQLVLAPPRPITPDLYNSLIWLRENTPRTKSPWNPRETPEYAVFSSWDHGHWIQYISERPTMVNNFGYQLRGEGLEDMLRVYFGKGENDVARVCDRRGIRYLFLSDVFFMMDTLPELIGIDFNSSYVAGTVPHGGMANLPIPNDNYASLAYSRMYMFDGSASPAGPALTRFRLIFESANAPSSYYLPPDTKEIKIFEYVKGARLWGSAGPREKVVLSCRLMTNFDRLFEYTATVTAGPDGRFEAVFPYATKEKNGAVIPLSRGLAYTPSRAAFFDVETADVLEGKPVRIDLAKGLPAGRHPAAAAPQPPAERRES
jgi:dolichyl-diphosphooligosaccharide--protein glycosyltransferase